MLTYQVESWISASEEMRPLWSQHYAELAQDQDSVPFSLNETSYRALDTAGLLLLVTVRDSGKMVGYSKNILTPHPHHATTLFGLNDSYFLLPEYRKGWAGVHLFRFAEECMRGRGVKKVVVTTQDNLDRGSVFTRLRMRRAGTVYTKVLN